MLSVQASKALLSDPVKGLVRFARLAARCRQPASCELAFVSAGRAAQGVWLRKPGQLVETLEVAKIAHLTPGAEPAVSRILVGARDRFGDFFAQTQIAETAHMIGQRDIHLKLMTEMAHYAPGQAAHVRVAEQLAVFARKDLAYAPLVRHSLSRANDRTVTFAQALATREAAERLGAPVARSEAAAIARRLWSWRHLDGAGYRGDVQRVLREVRAGGLGPWLAAATDYARVTAWNAFQIIGLHLASRAKD